MRMLVLGGTQFVGRHLVEAALAADHDVTLFHRGKTARGLFAEAEELIGDRDGGLDTLANGKWDVVVDTCGYVPRVVGDSARLLADRVEHYIFVSTVSVYGDFSAETTTEDSPLAEPPAADVEEITKDTYGGLKVACEQVVDEIYGEDRRLHVRPGLIVGPHDPTDRFTYWPARFGNGGTVLLPGNPAAPIQFIDARDLGAWIVQCAEEKRSGIYNTTGPEAVLTRGEFFDCCRRTLAPDAELVWASDDFLQEKGVPEFLGLPFWLPDNDEAAGLLRTDSSPAYAAGLAARPVADILRDTLEWHRERSASELKVGITAEREAELLAAHEQQAARESK